MLATMMCSRWRRSGSGRERRDCARLHRCHRGAALAAELHHDAVADHHRLAAACRCLRRSVLRMHAGNRIRLSRQVDDDDVALVANHDSLIHGSLVPGSGHFMRLATGMARIACNRTPAATATLRLSTPSPIGTAIATESIGLGVPRRGRHRAARYRPAAPRTRRTGRRLRPANGSPVAVGDPQLETGAADLRARRARATGMPEDARRRWRGPPWGWSVRRCPRSPQRHRSRGRRRCE